MSNNISQNIKKGLFWNSVSQMASSGISFLSIIILSRLLTPEDFGILGMISIFIAIANIFIDSGMGGSLFKKTNATVVDYSTLFFYNLIISVTMYAVLYFVAPVIASFYDKNILISLIRLLGLSIIINAFCTVQMLRILKELKFKAFAIINVISSIISLIIAICLAKNGYGVWTLVIQQLSLSGLTTLLMCLYNRFSLSFVFSIISFKEQFAFGINLLLSNLLKTITENVNSNIIAKTTLLVQTGYFVQSNKLIMTGNNIVSVVIDRTVFPIFAKIENTEEIKLEYIKLSKYVFSIVFPISAILALLSYQIIVIALGNRWSEAAWMLRILSITIIPLIVQTFCRNLLKSRANTRQIFFNELVKSILVISFLLIGVLLGLKFIIWGMVIAYTISCLWMMYSVSKEISYCFWQQLKDVLILIIISTLSYLFSNFIFTIIQNDDHFLNLLLGTVLMVISVLFFSYLLRQQEIFYVLRMARKLFHKKAKIK